jgi:hypothetical protein
VLARGIGGSLPALATAVLLDRLLRAALRGRGRLPP